MALAMSKHKTTYYSLSPYGMTLFPLVEALWSWGRIHLARGHTVSKTATAPDLRR